MKLASSLSLLLVLSSLVLRAEASGQIQAATFTVITVQRENYGARDRASHALGNRLPAVDVQALLRFLARKPNEDVVSAENLAVLKNNAADALLAQGELPAALLSILETTFADADQGEIWREYVVQKFPELVKRTGGVQRERGVAFLHERIADTSYIYAGTALLGLQRLHENEPPLVEGVEVAKAARLVLREDAYASASKISALQILARHEPSEARALARQWLADEHPVMLRVSALATLGQVGEQADREVVARYAESPELRLRTAARAALARLPVL